MSIKLEFINIWAGTRESRISNLVDAGIAKRQTASVYLKKLTGIGVLAERQVGRERLFTHPKLIQLLTHDSNAVKPYEGTVGVRRAN